MEAERMNPLISWDPSLCGSVGYSLRQTDRNLGWGMLSVFPLTSGSLCALRARRIDLGWQLLWPFRAQHQAGCCHNICPHPCPALPLGTFSGFDRLALYCCSYKWVGSQCNASREGLAALVQSFQVPQHFLHSSGSIWWMLSPCPFPGSYEVASKTAALSVRWRGL
jgi:hypothetical protein